MHMYTQSVYAALHMSLIKNAACDTITEHAHSVSRPGIPIRPATLTWSSAITLFMCGDWSWGVSVCSIIWCLLEYQVLQITQQLPSNF